MNRLTDLLTLTCDYKRTSNRSFLIPLGAIFANSVHFSWVIKIWPKIKSCPIYFYSSYTTNKQHQRRKSNDNLYFITIWLEYSQGLAASFCSIVPNTQNFLTRNQQSPLFHLFPQLLQHPNLFININNHPVLNWIKMSYFLYSTATFFFLFFIYKPSMI